MGYQLEIDKRANKELQSLDPQIKGRILKRLKALEGNPLPSAPNVKQIAPRLFRLRVGDWRVVYEVESRKVTIVIVAHRREVYRLLASRLD